jgi:hypothetical protein
VYENGRRPAGVRPTDWDGGCRCYKAGRNGRPLDKDSRCVASSRAMGGRGTARMCKGNMSAVSKWESEYVCGARSCCPAI